MTRLSAVIFSWRPKQHSFRAEISRVPVVFPHVWLTHWSINTALLCSFHLSHLNIQPSTDFSIYPFIRERVEKRVDEDITDIKRRRTWWQPIRRSEKAKSAFFFLLSLSLSLSLFRFFSILCAELFTIERNSRIEIHQSSMIHTKQRKGGGGGEGE